MVVVVDAQPVLVGRSRRSAGETPERSGCPDDMHLREPRAVVARPAVAVVGTRCTLARLPVECIQLACSKLAAAAAARHSSHRTFRMPVAVPGRDPCSFAQWIADAQRPGAGPPCYACGMADTSSLELKPKRGEEGPYARSAEPWSAMAQDSRLRRECMHGHACMPGNARRTGTRDKGRGSRTRATRVRIQHNR